MSKKFVYTITTGRCGTNFLADLFKANIEDARIYHERANFVELGRRSPDASHFTHFNTFGNLVADPRCGLLFIDFETGDTLQLSGRAEILFDPGTVTFQPGAERMVRVQIDGAILIRDAVPIGWEFLEMSPYVEFEEEQAAEVPAGWQGYRELLVERVVPESETITSFYLVAEDCNPLPAYKPGQFLPLRLDLDGEAVVRTYSLSDSPGDSDYYRLSIKREPAPVAQPDLPPGRSSTHFHECVRMGSGICAKEPRGHFSLDQESNTPVALLSGGVGLTPMISMLNWIVRTGDGRPVWFVHGTRNGEEHAFGEHVKTLARDNGNVRAHICYSQPLPTDERGVHYDTEGRVTIDLLQDLLFRNDYEFYLCGPGPFMESLYQDLREWGVPDERIRYEFFGPSTVLRQPGEEEPVPEREPAAGAEVVFDRAGVTAEWTSQSGMLLDLAEASGLSPPFSCRSGICHTCETRLIAGEVDYEQQPLDEPEEGHVLICCSRPRGRVVLDL